MQLHIIDTTLLEILKKLADYSAICSRRLEPHFFILHQCFIHVSLTPSPQSAWAFTTREQKLRTGHATARPHKNCAIFHLPMGYTEPKLTTRSRCSNLIIYYIYSQGLD